MACWYPYHVGGIQQLLDVFLEAILDFKKPCIGEMEDDLKCYLFCCKLTKPLHIVKILKNTRVLTKLPFLPPLPHRRGK